MTRRVTLLVHVLRRRARRHGRFTWRATAPSPFTIAFTRAAASREQIVIASASLLTPVVSFTNPLLRRTKGVRLLLRGARKNASPSVSFETQAIFVTTSVWKRAKPSRAFKSAFRPGESPFNARATPAVSSSTPADGFTDAFVFLAKAASPIAAPAVAASPPAYPPPPSTTPFTAAVATSRARLAPVATARSEPARAAP